MISSVAGQPPSLDRTISGHLDWWQNPTNVMRGADLHPKDHSIQLFTDASNDGWGAPLDQSSTEDLWSDGGKKATHKCSTVEGGLPGPSKFQGPVSQLNSASCNGQLNSGSLHKQTRRNSLSRDVRAPVEDQDMVPLLSHNIKARHIQGCLNVMADLLSRSNKVQSTELSLHLHVFKQICQKRFTPHVDLCHSSEPQTSTVCVSYPRPKCLGHRNSPRLARDALVLGLWDVAALNRDPTATSGVNNSSQIVPPLCASQQSTTSQPPRLVSRSGQLPRTRLLCGGGRENCCPSEVVNKDRLQVKVGPIREMVQRKFGGFLHSICETNLRFFHVPVPRSKQAPLDH